MNGSVLSHYKIQEELGRGGMGIVYRAEDTKLHRTVAIKVLPAAALASEDDRARFYREARAAAALTHPNIAVIHEIDEVVPEGSKDDDLRPFIAMEYIEGDTLEDHIKKGPMKLEEAVRLASEVAEGLKAAHEKGIVHRDIKASNVMLDGSGRAKILDFGLALTAQSTKLTRMGSTLGTVAYMSPEQAKGEEVDGRTDIWALGVMLYELVSGRHPFAGDYEQAVVYSILNEDPEPLTAIRTGVPMGLEWIIGKMLAKKADQRYQTIADLLVDLGTVDLSTVGMSQTSGMHSTVMAAPGFTKRSAFLSERTRLALAVLGTVLMTVVIMFATRQDAASDDQRFLKLPLYVEGVAEIVNPLFSMDRNKIMFMGEDSNQVMSLYELNIVENRLSVIADLPNGAWGAFPRESPDGRHLVFHGGSSIWMKAMPFGTPEELVPRAGLPVWSDDRTVAYKRIGESGLYTIDIESREVQELIASDTTGQADFNRYIYHFYPEHKAALVGREYVDGSPADLYWVEIPGGRETLIGEGMINAFLLNDSHLMFQPGDNDRPWLLQPFDLETKSMIGSPHELLSSIDWIKVWASPTGDLLVAEPEECGTSGVFVYDLESGPMTEMTWMPEGCLEDYSISADGSEFSFNFAAGATTLDDQLLVGSVVEGSYALIPDDDNRQHPEFSPDGTSLFVTISRASGEQDIKRVATSGIGSPELVVENASNPDVAPAAGIMAFRRRDGDNRQLWTVELSTGEERLLDSNTNSTGAIRISPDGRKVMYGREQDSEFWVVDVQTGTNALLSDHLIHSWMSDSRSIMSLDNERLYQQDVYLEDGAFVFGPREYLDDLDASDWRSFRVAPDNGNLIVFFGEDPYEDKNHTVLEWWQNFDTQLERIAPTPGK